MTNNIQVRATLTIKDGKLAAFKKAAADCVATVKAKDTGTQQYDWFLDDDETVCIVRETYADSDAAMQHLGNIGAAIGALTETADISLEIFGELSPALSDAVAAFQPKIWKPFIGL